LEGKSSRGPTVAKKRGAFYCSEDAINASICYADQLMVDMQMTTKDGEQAQRELRSAIALLRVCEKSIPSIREDGYLGVVRNSVWDDVHQWAIARAILRADRIASKRKERT
jgi:hypothetical protein